jgi:hypothetical protein
MARRKYEAGELTRSEILQRNERIKALSGLCKTFGVALAIAGAGRWFYTAFDEYTLLACDWRCVTMEQLAHSDVTRGGELNAA